MRNSLYPIHLILGLATVFCACGDKGQAPEPAPHLIAFSHQAFGQSPDIYTILSNGDSLRAITVHPNFDIFPKWSPDGQSIMFQSNRSGKWHLYHYNYDSGNLVQLTQGEGHFQNGQWSPNGAKIAYQASINGNDDIYIQNLNEGTAQQLTHHQSADVWPQWSPDESQIAFVSHRDGNSEIYIMNSDGSGKRRLTHADRVDQEPVWSPDGNQIAFTTHRDVNDEEVYVAQTDGSGIKSLSTSVSDEYNPIWSADGDKIYYYNISLGRIYEVPSDGSKPPTVIFDYGQARDLSLSPDGKSLVFVAKVADSPLGIMTLDLSTYDFRKVSNTQGTDRTPRMRP